MGSSSIFFITTCLNRYVKKISLFHQLATGSQFITTILFYLRPLAKLEHSNYFFVLGNNVDLRNTIMVRYSLHDIGTKRKKSN